MMRALWTAGTGMRAQQSNLDVISNNLANVNTTGFKKQRAEFEDLMYQTERQPCMTSSGNNNMLPTGVQLGHGVRLTATARDFSQGNFQSTSNAMDMVIEGDGFFQITMPDGTLAYTRNGAFKPDGNGNVVTSEGYLLEPAIQVPEGSTDFGVSRDGIVTITPAGQTTPQEIGQITIARFINNAGLKSIGKNLYTETVASGAPVVGNPGDNNSGTIVTNFVEMSNVQVVDEMVNMIVAQRAYEMNSKAVTTADSMLEVAAGLKR